MYEIAHNVSMVLKYPENKKNRLLALKKEFLISYNFDLIQNFDL